MFFASSNCFNSVTFYFYFLGSQSDSCGWEQSCEVFNWDGFPCGQIWDLVRMVVCFPQIIFRILDRSFYRIFLYVLKASRNPKCWTILQILCTPIPEKGKSRILLFLIFLFLTLGQYIYVLLLVRMKIIFLQAPKYLRDASISKKVNLCTCVLLSATSVFCFLDFFFFFLML